MRPGHSGRRSRRKKTSGDESPAWAQRPCLLIRAVVIDDTSLYRGLVSELLAGIPDVRVVATAPDGKQGLAKILSLKPDLVTLDIEMPEMNGIEVLKALAGKELDTAVVMVSSLTRAGAELTMRALELGAAGFVLKPENGKEGLEAMARELGAIIEAIREKRQGKGLPGSTLPSASPAGARESQHGASLYPPGLPKSALPVGIVAIGASTGGPQALLAILPRIAGPLRIPLLIVQHMPPIFTANLARSLGSRCSFPVKEAQNGETMAAGTAYIAPGGCQTKIALGADARTKVFRVTDDPPENNCKPSVDYLFRSVAQHFFGRALGVIMTGMGSDGAAGLGAIKRSEGLVLAQDEASSVVWGMPRAALHAGVVDAILSLEALPAAIERCIAGWPS